MMNVIEIQDALKGMPMEQLIREMQMPSGQAPQFLVLGEITRRREMEKAYAQNQGQPQTTVAQDAVAASGVPQGGIAGIARAMAPNTDMAQNTGAAPQAPVQQMASGGYVQKMQRGGIADLERAQRNVERSTSARVGTRTSNPRIMQIANMFGITVEDAHRMVEYAPELLYTLAPPSAMATAPGISAKPLRRTLAQVYRSRPGAFRRGVDEPAMPGPIPLPVGGSTTAEKPSIPLYPSPYSIGDIAATNRLGMDTSEAAAQMNARLPPASVELLQPPPLAQVMEQYGFTAAEAQQFIDNNPAYRGARYGGEGSSAVVPEAAPPGFTDAIPMRPVPLYPFIGSQEEYAARLAEWERKKAAIEAERARIAADNQEPEILEGGTTPAGGPPVAPPLPPGRGVIPPTTPTTSPAAPPIAGAMSPLEGEIANLLQQREKRAEQDKWLALAQTGLALMGSRQPTFAGALGEAGAAGLTQFQQSRAQYDKDRLELLALQESTRLNRAKLAAAGRGGGLTPYQAATLARQMRSDAAGELTALIELRKGLEDPMGNPPTDERLGQWNSLNAHINSLVDELYGISGGDTGGEDFVTSAARAS